MRNRLVLVSTLSIAVWNTGCADGPDAATTAPATDTAALARLKAAETEAAKVDLVAANLNADDALHLLTRFVTPTGSVIEFFEPEKGVIQMWEMGKHGVSAFGSGPYGKKPTEIFQAARPDLPIPTSLILAQARTDEGRFPANTNAAGATQQLKETSEVVAPESWCGSAWFVQNVPYAAWACEPSLFGFQGSTQACWTNTFSGTYTFSGANGWVTDAEAFCNPTSSNGHITFYRSDYQNGQVPVVNTNIGPDSWFNAIDTSTGTYESCDVLGFLDCYPHPNTHNLTSVTFSTPNGASVSAVAFTPSSGTPSTSPPVTGGCQECYYDCGVGCQDVGRYCTNENIVVSAAANPGCGYCGCQ